MKTPATSWETVLACRGTYPTPKAESSAAPAMAPISIPAGTRLRRRRSPVAVLAARVNRILHATVTLLSLWVDGAQAAQALGQRLRISCQSSGIPSAKQAFMPEASSHSRCSLVALLMMAGRPSASMDATTFSISWARRLA